MKLAPRPAKPRRRRDDLTPGPASPDGSAHPVAEDRATFAAVLEEAFARMDRGQKTYGPFRPETDPRDLRREAEEELLDAIVYCYFAILALRGRRP